MKSFPFTITFTTLLFFAFLSSCQENEKATKSRRQVSSASEIDHSRLFVLDTSETEALRVYHEIIEDEQGSAYDLYAFNNFGNFFTKLYLLKDQQCLDSIFLSNNSTHLSKFEALPSKKKIHAIYSEHSSLQDPGRQAIITVKDQKIAIPLTLHHETDIKTSIGTGSLDILNEDYSLYEINLKLLDTKNQCIVRFEQYEKMYNIKTKKFKTERDKGTFTYHYDPTTEAFCSSVKHLDVPYMDCHGQKKILKGSYPVRDYGKDDKDGLYFTVFVGREWHIYMYGFLMPESEPCYALMDSYR